MSQSLQSVYVFGLGVPLFIDNGTAANRVKWGLWAIHKLLLTAVYGIILFMHHSKWKERLPGDHFCLRSSILIFPITLLIFLNNSFLTCSKTNVLQIYRIYVLAECRGSICMWDFREWRRIRLLVHFYSFFIVSKVYQIIFYLTRIFLLPGCIISPSFVITRSILHFYTSHSWQTFFRYSSSSSIIRIRACRIIQSRSGLGSAAPQSDMGKLQSLHHALKMAGFIHFFGMK